jgi:hypothetical protein
MKKVFIVLLIAAIGAGVYYYYSKKSKPFTQKDFKELIVGKWKIDSLDISRSRDSTLNIIALVLIASDSNLRRYEFDFQKNGLVTEGLDGKAGDTSYYVFETDNELLAWTKSDTVKTKWTIGKLDSANLVLQSKDSTIFSFRKIPQ